jgi:hypothetical protein
VPISEDLEFQRKQWRVQRIGWACMTVLIAAAALGGAGEGPLSSRTAEAPGGDLALDYQRVVRREAPTTLELRVAPGADDSAIWFNADYLDRVTIRSITPAPSEARLGGDRHVFVFSQASARGGTIAVELEPNSAGSLVGEAGVVGRAPAGFRQLVLP